VRFDSDLIIENGDDRVLFTGDDGVLVITSDRLVEVALTMRSSVGASHIGLRTISDHLAHLGATVRFETPSTPLLTLGANAKPQLLTRVARMPHVQIESTSGILRSLIQVVLAKFRSR
jgi:hypothetical protein